MSTIALPRPAAASPLASPLVMLMGFCTFLNLYAVQSLLPLFEQTFGASKAAVGLTVSATTLAVALASPLVGVGVEKLDRRKVLVGSFVAIALATLGAASAPGLHALVGWRFLQGLFIPGAYVAAMAVIGESWGAERAGAAMATYVAGNVLGGFAGRMIAGLVASAAGWQTAFVVLGLLDLAGAAAAWACLGGVGGKPLAPRGTTVGELPGLLAHPRLAPIYAAGFVMLFTLVALFTYVDYRLAEPPFGLGAGAIGCVFMVYLLGVVVTPIAGRWIDRLGFRAMGGLALFTAALGVCLTLAPSLPVVVAGLAIAASGVFVGQAAATSLLAVTAGSRRAPAAGLYLGCYYAGGSVGGVLPALAWNAGGWPACVALIACTALAAAGWMLAAWPRRGEARTL